MADSVVEEAALALSNININVNGDSQHSEAGESTHSDIEKQWGFPLEELYRLSLAFYKEKEGKAVQLAYQEKVKFVALTKQALHGSFKADVAPDVGFLDVVGNDRRQAWQAVGDMSKEAAMESFVRMLNSSCPMLKPYIEAHRREHEEQEKARQEAEAEAARQKQEENDRSRLENEARAQQEAEQYRQRVQEQQIRDALNQQTAIQYKQYAEQVHPGNPTKQAELIAQLQEQHFQYYMQQVYQQQVLHQQQQWQQLQALGQQQQQMAAAPGAVPIANGTGASETTVAALVVPAGAVPAAMIPAPELAVDAAAAPATAAAGQNGEAGGDVADDEASDDDNDEEESSLVAASMWTRKDIKEFKANLGNDKDAVIKVGSGETVTIRVPTHEEGTCLFWEFASDYYDLGFGVYFEWSVDPGNAVSVHVSESSDDEDDEDDEDGTGGEGGKGDVERGSKADNRPPMDEIIPVYRRDCHEEVYCGSHVYPGRGVYLLKFDNSYSLWRAKTLYYRVYYTK